jgi:hypothetical protein
LPYGQYVTIYWMITIIMKRPLQLMGFDFEV